MHLGSGLRLGRCVLMRGCIRAGVAKAVPLSLCRGFTVLRTLQERNTVNRKGKPHQNEYSTFGRSFASPVLFLLAGLPLLLWSGLPFQTIHAESPDKSVDENKIPTHTFRLEEVKRHGPESKRPWVIRNQSVYDITDWIAGHPGGEVILKAAGGSVEPYWKIFNIHQKQEVYDILEQYLIGSVDERDLVDGMVPEDSVEDPFLGDPERDEKLMVLTDRPCNAETPGEDLAGFLTPNGVFYVRNHMWVPSVQEDEYRLVIELNDGEEKSYSLQDIKEKFTWTTVHSTMQCSGNRRKHMTDACGSTQGLPWSVGAIGNATWTGVRLRDVLIDAGFPVDNPPEDAKHAQFQGLEAYGASIPILKALDTHGDVLLAFEMNGSRLPLDHGYPLRVVVPGIVAARNVKWVQKIVISDEESTSQWQRRDYKSFGPNEGANPDWERARAIQEMPVTSAITSISPKKDKSAIIVEGYAYSGGGREIVRVDISKDNGKTWDQAQLLSNDENSLGNKKWCWKRWRYEILGDSKTEGERENEMMVVVKATDEAYNTQPEGFGQIYNVRGNLATAWHRVGFGPADGRSGKKH